MDAFIEITSKAIPVALDEVDTDQIIPAEFLTSVSRDGYGQNLFCGLRQRDSSFPLNDSRYEKREIMLVGKNFGCGSSREHAVWALTGYGLKVIIGKSFADIFKSNSAKNGLLLIVLPEPIVDELVEVAQRDDSFSLTVSLEHQKITLADGTTHAFEYDSFSKHCLLSGLDDIDYICSKKKEVVQFRIKQEQHRFAQELKCPVP